MELAPIKLEEYTINGHVIDFRPGDPDWLEAYTTMADSIEQAIANTEEEQKEVDNNPVIAFKFVKQKDAIIREKIDSVFGKGTADAVYSGNMMTFSNGLPIWFSFLMSMSESIEEFINEQSDKGNERIKKYQAKFQKYTKKR